MNDIHITLTGNVAAEPRQYSFEDGARVTSLRVLTTHRFFDKRTGQWTDGERVCFAVRCWRSLGENVAKSVQVGQPVVVSGKLRIREFGPDGDRRFMPEVEASAVGHDLRWGTGVFAKPERSGGPVSVSKEMRDRLDEDTQDWALGTKPVAERALPTRPDNPTTEQPLEQKEPLLTAPRPLTEEPLALTVGTKNDLTASVLGTTARRPLESVSTTDDTKRSNTPAPKPTHTPSTSTPSTSTSSAPTQSTSTSSGPAPSTSTSSAPTSSTPTSSTSSPPTRSRSVRAASTAASPPSDRNGNATVRILGADDSDPEAKDTDRPTEERAAA